MQDVKPQFVVIYFYFYLCISFSKLLVVSDV